MSVRRHLAVIAAILATLPFSHVSAEIVSYEADRVDCTTFAPICRVEVSDITGTTSSEPSGSQESHVFNVRFSDMRHIEVVEPALILLSINLFFNPEESGGYSIFEISGALTNEFGESLITTSSFFNVSFNPNRIFVALEFFILDPSFIFHGFSLSASAPVNLTTGEVNGVDVTPGGVGLIGGDMVVGTWAAVPEPATLPLLGIGLLALTCLRRKRAKTVVVR